jgi:hypothetical protein
MTGAKLRNRKSGCQQPLNDFSLFESRKDGACDADQTGADGNSDACNRKPFTFRKFQVGVPYRIDETQPCDDSARERYPKCLDFCKGPGQSHSQSLLALCVEMVAGRGSSWGGGPTLKPSRGGGGANSEFFGRTNRNGSHSENFSRWEIFALRANHRETLYPSVEVDGLHWFAVRTNWTIRAEQNFKSTIDSIRFARFALADSAADARS